MKVAFVTWNIGKGDIKYKVVALLQELHKACASELETCDYVVIALQETNRSDFRKVEREIDQYKQDAISNRGRFPYSVIKRKGAMGACNSIHSFMIGTVVLQKDGSKNVLSVDSKSNCVWPYTKGFHTLLITGETPEESMVVVNAHLPFQQDITHNAGLLSTLINDGNKDFKQKKYGMMVVLGDLNSRTFLLQGCSMKNTPRDQQSFLSDIQKYIQEKEKRQEKEKQEKRSILEQHTELAKIQHGSDSSLPCLGGNVSNYKGKNLVTNDFLYFMMKSSNTEADVNSVTPEPTKSSRRVLSELSESLEGFVEPGIAFFPTYKRNKITGQFETRKDNHGRLPGYADRVIYKPNPCIRVTQHVYESIYMTGNDHLPVVCILTTDKSEKLTHMINHIKERFEMISALIQHSPGINIQVDEQMASGPKSQNGWTGEEHEQFVRVFTHELGKLKQFTQVHIRPGKGDYVDFATADENNVRVYSADLFSHDKDQITSDQHGGQIDKIKELQKKNMVGLFSIITSPVSVEGPIPNTSPMWWPLTNA